QVFPPRAGALGEVALRIQHLRRPGVLHNVSFEVRRGEIFGVAGMMGSGRTELLRALHGADPGVEGTIELDGKRLSLRSPAEAIEAGIVLAPEDRKHQGLFLDLSIRENISLAR